VLVTTATPLREMIPKIVGWSQIAGFPHAIVGNPKTIDQAIKPRKASLPRGALCRMIVPPASMIQVSLSEFTQGLLPAYQASIFKYECKLAAHPWCFATMPLIFVGTDCPFLRCTLHQGCDGFLPSRHGSRANSWRSRAGRQANHRPHGLGGPGLK